MRSARQPKLPAGMLPVIPVVSQWGLQQKVLPGYGGIRFTVAMLNCARAAGLRGDIGAWHRRELVARVAARPAKLR